MHLNQAENTQASTAIGLKNKLDRIWEVATLVAQCKTFSHQEEKHQELFLRLIQLLKPNIKASLVNHQLHVKLVKAMETFKVLMQFKAKDPM